MRSTGGPAISVAIHCGVLLLLFAAGSHLEKHAAHEISAPAVRLIAPYLEGRGGGGGGSRSVLPASHGNLPRFTPRQVTPPLAVVLDTHPKLLVEPTIIAPPDIQLLSSNLAELGDPFGAIGPQSNGPGRGGGIGDGNAGGIGPGSGPGFGAGEGGDYGGLRALPLSGAVSSPVLLYKVEPEFSEEARKAKLQGVVILSGEVGTNGRLRNVHVVQGLGLGLDEKAVAAVAQWRFRPASRQGRPVPSAATIEVHFHLL